MILIRCTQRLLKGNAVPVDPDPVAPEAPLSEWYANAVPLPFPGRWMVLYTEAHTLLTVLAPGRSLKATLPGFRKRLGPLLRALELPEAWIAERVAAAESATFARTADRSVISTMNQLAQDLRWFAAEVPSFEKLRIEELEWRATINPNGIRAYAQPMNMVRALAGLPRLEIPPLAYASRIAPRKLYPYLRALLETSRSGPPPSLVPVLVLAKPYYGGTARLIGLTGEGEVCGDSWHASMDEARERAKEMFGAALGEWEPVSNDHSSARKLAMEYAAQG